MLVCVPESETESECITRATHDLLDDLTGRVEVDEALVDLQLVAIPGLRTLTTRLLNVPSMSFLLY